MTQQAHSLLFSSFGVDVHINRSIDALIDDEDGQFTINAASERAPETGVFWCITLRVLNGQVAKARSVEDDALDARVNDGFDLFGMQPRACNELSKTLTGFVSA